MASSATVIPTPNGSSSNGAISGGKSATSGNKAQSKVTASTKAVDPGMRQGEGAADMSYKRPTQKAWTHGANPITQRSSHQQNGFSHATKGQPPKAMASRETNTVDKHANDRLMFLLANFMGLSAKLTTKTGDKYTGIFAGFSTDNNESAYLMKMVQNAASTTENGENGYVGVGTDYAMSFYIKDVVDLAAENITLEDTAVKPQNGTQSAFKTDADIAGNLAMRERNLQRWEPAADTDVDLSLESAGGTTWDQFETNERLYGLKTDYHEEIYTTSIDRSNPLYKQRAARAEKIAREIENQSTSNAHLREERGQADAEDGNLDEETKYSGVRRDASEFPNLSSGHSNRYTPPARRAPTGQPTVPGAPVDPAIISSQISRPEAKFSHERKGVQTIPTTVPTQSGAEEQTKRLPVATIAPPQPASAVKGVSDPEHSKDATSRALAPTMSASPNRKIGPTENATTNVETEVLDSFRQFANTEKLRIQARRRDQLNQDKAIKLNDLMKFSKNFKLHTPVPKDLVPILAKDKSKQDEIMEKAQRCAEEASKNIASKPAAPNNDQKTQRPLSTARYDVGITSPIAPVDRQNFPRGRQGHAPQGQYNNHNTRSDRSYQAPNNSAAAPRSGTGGLGHRLADIQRQKQAGASIPVPTPLPIHEKRIPPTGPAVTTSGISSPAKRSNTQTPTSAVSSKFNVKAMEFKPNPAASSFTPVGNPSVASSPRSSVNLHTSRAPSPSAFFGRKKPLPRSERPSIRDHFNTIKRLKKESEEQETTQIYASNGGIRPAYKTPPTWSVAKENEDKTYQDMFENVPYAPSATPPSHISPPNAPLPHQHQLPFHLQHGAQGMPQMHAPQHAPPHLHPNQHLHPAGPHHYDDHRMHLSASSSSVYPSPRPQYTNMAYASPMTQHAQLAAYGQPMQPYFVGPNGPQPAPIRHFSGGPHFVPPPGAHLAAPLMVHQSSNSSFMNMPPAMALPFNPQMHMYSPGQAHAVPQYGGPPQPPSNYPSPGRGAPLMIHQGSQQGQHPQQVMFMGPGHHGQPMYAQQPPQQMAPMRGGYGPPQGHYYGSSPHQQHHLPPHSHRGPSGNYGQPPGPHGQHAGPPLPPPTAPAAHAVPAGEDAK